MIVNIAFETPLELAHVVLFVRHTRTRQCRHQAISCGKELFWQIEALILSDFSLPSLPGGSVLWKPQMQQQKDFMKTMLAVADLL